MKHLGEFINLIAKKAGIENEQIVIDFLANPKLAEISVSPEFVTALDAPLISIKTAIAGHPDIKKHYTGQALATVDAKLEELADTHELTDDQKTELKGIKSTYERLLKTVGFINEKKPKPADKEDTGKLQQQVKDLLVQIQTLQTSNVKTQQEADEKVQAFRTSQDFETLTGKYKTKYDDLEPEARFAVINTLMQAELGKLSANFGYDEKNAFSLLRSDKTIVTDESNVQLTPKTLLEKVLAKNNVLVVSNTPEKPVKTATTTVNADKEGPKGNNQRAALEIAAGILAANEKSAAAQQT